MAVRIRSDNRRFSSNGPAIWQGGSRKKLRKCNTRKLKKKSHKTKRTKKQAFPTAVF